MTVKKLAESLKLQTLHARIGQKLQTLRARIGQKLQPLYARIGQKLQPLHRARIGQGKGAVWYSLFVCVVEVAAIAGIFLVIVEFNQTRQALKEERVARAWQIVTTRAPGNSGKIAALETLGRELEPDDDKYVPLDGLNLSCAFMGGTDKNGTCVNRTYLANLNLSPANLNKKKVNLSKADLTGAILTKANLVEANLIRATLSEADLTGANLTGAYLTLANLTGADLTGATLTGAYLFRATLTGANLISANLSEADLTGANLTGASLTGANLTWANLNEADLNAAKLYEANLSCANFMDVKNIDTVKGFDVSAEKALPEKAWAWSDKRPFGSDEDFDKKIVYYEFDENAGQYRWKKPQNTEEVEFDNLPDSTCSS